MTLGTNETGTTARSAFIALPRWLKWTLMASLAFNLLIIGSAIGHRVMGHHGYGRGSERGSEIGVMGYVRKLDTERRAVITKAIKAEKPDLKALREDIRKARIEAGEVLVAVPFDKEKVRAAMARISDAEAKLKATGISTMLTAAEQMTAEERLGLLEFWKRRRPWQFREPKERGPAKADDAAP